jgi:hypothetical protein
MHQLLLVVFDGISLLLRPNASSLPGPIWIPALSVQSPILRRQGDSITQLNQSDTNHGKAHASKPLYISYILQANRKGAAAQARSTVYHQHIASS